MDLVNRLVAAGIDPLMALLGQLPRLAGLAVLSAATGVTLLLVVRATSNQRRLAEVKRAIRAGLFEIRLFGDDPRAILRTQAELVRHNLTYLRLSFVPLLWAFVPLVLLTAQLQSFFAYDGLEPGRTSVVKVRLADDWQARGGAVVAEKPAAEPALTIETPEGVRVETPMAWTSSTDEAAWRVAIDRPGEYTLVVRFDGEAFSKSLHASNQVARRSPVRPARGLAAEVLHPAEPPLPDGSGLRSIEVAYPSRGLSAFGIEFHWMVWFIVLTMAFAFALKRPLGVVL
jgi:uncharacterized membrane protein (DUF106 family)